MAIEIDYKIVIVGIIGLTMIFVTLALTKQMNETLNSLIIGIIALAIGVVVPAPKIDNKQGVLRW